MLTVLLLVFLACLFLGVPVVFSMGASAFSAFLNSAKFPLTIIPARLFGGLDSFPLMAVPYFILAGKFMEEGGVSQRLVNFSHALVGFLKGGLGMVAVVASMIFAGISGSAAADTSAIGSILIPSLVRKGYKKGFVACLISSAGTIGPVIPPSLMMIIYSSITGLSVATLFLGGFLPGIIMGIVLMILCYLYALRHPTGQEERLKLSIREIWRTFKQAWIALIMPVIIIGGIIFGVFTPTEAGAIAVVIAFVVGAFIYKEIDLKKCWKILISSAKTSAVVLLIVGMATLFGWILAINKFPQLSIAFLTNISKNPNVIMLIIIGFLLIVGCFVETVAALIIFTPFLYPICSQFGYDPIHFALVVIMTLLIGQVTPPLGILLFLSSAMTDVKIRESLKFIAPFILMLTIAVLCVAYVPDFVLIIPKLILGYH